MVTQTKPSILCTYYIGVTLDFLDCTFMVTVQSGQVLAELDPSKLVNSETAFWEY